MRGGYTIDPVQGDHGSTSHVWTVSGRGLPADHLIMRGHGGPGEAGSRVPSEKRRPAAGRSQGLAFNSGEGRVVVLAEAAMMTAQVTGWWRTPVGINTPGSDDRQFALNVVRWLAHEL